METSGVAPPRERLMRFKTFAQRVEEVDVDVFRSLAPVKFEPTGGSSFFHEHLLRWRELNCAGDFNDVYLELLPLVQTLPQLFFHKDTIVTSLLSRLRLSAILSLEPILGLIALLSRDLGQDFLLYLPKFLDSCFDLLKSGGDREPELMEQVFVSISYVIKYLMKLLTSDILFVLKVTKQLRFYNRSYVQDFVAESVSFLLRKAPVKELIKGIRRILMEVVEDPSENKISGSSIILSRTIKGPASGLHSQAESILKLLMDRSILSGARENESGEGRQVIVKVVAQTFRILYENIHREKLQTLWSCLVSEIFRELSDVQSHGLQQMVDQENISTVTNDDLHFQHRHKHLVHLLSLVNDLLEFRKGVRVSDYKPLFELSCRLMVPEFITSKALEPLNISFQPLAPLRLVEDQSSKLTFEILRFCLALTKSHSLVAGASIGPRAIAAVATSWSIAFDCIRANCLFPFLRGLLEQDSAVVQIFAHDLFRSMDRLIDVYPADVLPLLMDLILQFESSAQLNCSSILSSQRHTRLSSFIVNLIQDSTRQFRTEVNKQQMDANESLALEPAMVWVVLQCFPYILEDRQANALLVWEYAMAVDEHLNSAKEPEDMRRTWEYLLATALSSHTKVLKRRIPHMIEIGHCKEFFNMTMRHYQSAHVLQSLVEFLDATFGESNTADITRKYQQLLAENEKLLLLQSFRSNLSAPDKALRIVSLRILFCYEPLSIIEENIEQHTPKAKDHMSNSGVQEKETHTQNQLFQKLLFIEDAPLSIENCRQCSILLTSIKVEACIGKIRSPYLVPLIHAMIGLLYNRFSLLWDTVIDCLAGILVAHGSIIWDVLLTHFQGIQTDFLCQGKESVKADMTEPFEAPQDIWTRFESVLNKNVESTDTGTFSTLHLRVFQKVPKFGEGRSRQLIPLFLKFVGHSEALDSHAVVRGGGKQWKVVLREWLKLLKEMKNARSFFSGSAVKDILLKRFLMDSDPDIQKLTLDCILNWKDTYLTSYEEHLQNLISYKTLRDELTTWKLSREGQEIQDEHREQLLSVVLHILYPKIMKRSTKSLGKNGTGVQRNAVLSFLAYLETKEIAPLFCLLMRPMESSFGGHLVGSHAVMKYGWESIIQGGVKSDFIELLCTETVAVLPYKRKMGFLHMVMDSLTIFNVNQLSPYIHALLGVVMRLLECSYCKVEEAVHYDWRIKTVNGTREGENTLLEERLKEIDLPESVSVAINHPCDLDEMGTNGKGTDAAVNPGEVSVLPEEFLGQDIGKDVQNFSSSNGRGGGFREARTLCFKILGIVLRKFDKLDFHTTYWDIFFQAIKHPLKSFSAENSASSTPSTLFTCFLAISRRVELAPLLAKEPALVPSILSVLSVKIASPAVISTVLSFVENLLDLEVSGDEEGMEVVKAVLIPHMHVLLSRMHDYLGKHQEGVRGKHSLRRELRVLTRLSKHICDPAEAAKLIDVLIPFLRLKRHLNEETCLEALNLIQGIGPSLDTAIVNKCLSLFSPLLLSVSNSAIRVSVSHILVTFSTIDQSLSTLAGLIADLNAMSTGVLDEFDYNRRLLAYDRINHSLFSHLTHSQVLLALSHVIYDMGSEDMSIRHQASDCLQRFVRWVAGLHGTDQKTGGTDESETFELDMACETEQDCKQTTELKQNQLCVTTIEVLAPQFLLPHVRNAMCSDVLVVRREWVLLLREMALHLSQAPVLKEYQCLISSDLEVDFFYNAVHLQTHRRIKAMTRFKSFCSSKQFSQGSLARIFVPLFMNALFEARGDKEGNLVSVGIETIAFICAHLLWEPYVALLMRCIRQMASKTVHQKVLVRLVCAILDEFHFFVPLPESADVEMKDKLPNGISGVGDHIEKAAATLSGGQNMVGNLSAETQHFLQKKILPEVRKLMISKSNIASTPVALAQVKILKLMPPEVAEVELPQIMRTVINLLKSRSQAVRDEARAALVAMSKTLGPCYLHFIVNLLQSSLTKGFEVHVLGYTLNSILVKIVNEVKVGEIDYCLDQLLDVMETDIMGEVSEEKDVEAIAVKMKETKHMRSFESLQLIAQVATFRKHAATILSRMQRNLEKSFAPKVKAKLETMLRHIIMGFQQNSSVTYSDLLVLVHSLIENGVKEEQSLLDAAATKQHVQMNKLGSSKFGASIDVTTPKPNAYLTTQFSLQLLHNRLSHVKVSPLDSQLLAMLNPLVGLLQQCLNSKYDGVLSSAMKCLSLLLMLPLPAVNVHGEELLSLLFSLCQRYTNTQSPLLQASCNVLVVLIRHCKADQLTEELLRTLLTFPIFMDMEVGSSMAFSLLKAIVSRKLLVPELYDLMNRVANIMVTSQVIAVQQLSSKIMLQFLLDYPLGQKRLQQHLDFFVANIGYAHTSGREASLEMLHTVIMKFPDAVLEEQAESLFLPLVTRLVNDETSHVRAMIGKILKILMERVGSRCQQRFFHFSLSWYKSSDRRLWRPAAQVLGFLIEVMGTSFDRYVEDLLPQCVHILEQAPSSIECGQEEGPTNTHGLLWQEVYFSLTLVEKLLQCFPELILLPKLEVFWKLVCSLLLHQHLWIRKVSGRLLGVYFVSCKLPDSQRLELVALHKEETLFLHPSWVLLLVALFCKQLDGTSMDEPMGGEVLRNLVFATSLLPLLPIKEEVDETRPVFMGCDDLESRDRLFNALGILGGDKERSAVIAGSILQKLKADNAKEEEQSGYDIISSNDRIFEMKTCWALCVVFERLQKVALRVHTVQTKVVLRWYSAMLTQLGGAGIVPYLPSIVQTLYKLTESSAKKVVPDDVKQLGEEILNTLREVVGVSKFLHIYNVVRDCVKENRNKRKHAEKISVLVDPEKNAQKKIKMTAKKKAQKKRKLIMGKMTMGI